MSESAAPMVLILLFTCVGLLILMLVLMCRIFGRLSRLEKLVGQNLGRTAPAEQALSAAETSQGGAFEAFLAEDPGRRKLPKGEQFGAYRKWRQEKGMNWSNS